MSQPGDRDRDVDRDGEPGRDTDEAGPAGTADRLLGGRVALRQPARGYRAAIDPVLLAAAVPARAGDHVLDLGCGTGAAALCLLARVPDLTVTALEVHPELAAFACANARANGADDRMAVHTGDLLDPPDVFAGGSFDHSFANPPYLPAGAADAPADPLRAAAHVEGAAGLGDWVRALARLTRRKGTLSVIHRADRLPELLAALSGVAGQIAVCPLWPSSGKPAKRVLVQARAGIAGPASLRPGLTLHDAEGFSPQARAVLEDAAPLAI